MCRAVLGLLHQTRAMQMQLGHRVAQDIVVSFDQLFVEMLDREAAIEIAIQAQHAFDLHNGRTTQRWRQTPVGQTLKPALAMTIPPPTERAFTDPKQLRRLDWLSSERSDRLQTSSKRIR